MGGDDGGEMSRDDEKNAGMTEKKRGDGRMAESVLATPSLSQPDRPLGLLEAWARIELACKGFADPCLTTWLPGHIFSSISLSADEFLRIFRALLLRF